MYMCMYLHVFTLTLAKTMTIITTIALESLYNLFIRDLILTFFISNIHIHLY